MAAYQDMTTQDQQALQALNRSMRSAARAFASAPGQVERVIETYTALAAAGLSLPDGTHITPSGDGMAKSDVTEMIAFVQAFRAWVAAEGYGALLNRYLLG